MKKLQKDQLRKLVGGKFAPPPCTVCNDPNESPETNQIATYYSSYGFNGCYLGGEFISGTNICVFYTTQYSCPISGLNPQYGLSAFCGGPAN